MKILNLTPFIEFLFLVMLIAGASLQLAGMPVNYLIIIALGGLALSFFMHAYRPTNIDFSEDEQLGFKELLGTNIIPKVIWISTCIATLGIMFFLLKLEFDAYKKMMYIGGGAMVIGVLILLSLKLSGARHVNASLTVLFRSLPVLAVVGYILFS